MKINFEKKGKKFTVEISIDKVTITTDGITVKCEPQHNYERDMWGYMVSKYADKAFFNAIKVNPGRIFITHESAHKAKEQRDLLVEQEKEREINDIKTGKQPIKARYHDGEYLSGYIVFGRAADLLIEIGLARYVAGWGVLLERSVVDALGESFTYPQAYELAKPALEETEKQKAAAEEKRRMKFEEAKTTGKPVELSRYTTGCNDPHEDCDLDVVVSYAMPDGSVKTERHHTW